MNREAIDAALFALIWDGSTFKNDQATARKLRHWNDVSAAEMPALFLAGGKQIVIRTAANGLPTHWHIMREIYVYVRTAGAASPQTVLNPILDLLDAKLGPNGIGTPQTLGGLVQYARIEGTIETSEGTLGDLEVAIIPVLISATA
jgi:hypothetical protein